MTSSEPYIIPCLGPRRQQLDGTATRREVTEDAIPIMHEYTLPQPGRENNRRPDNRNGSVEIL